MQGVTVIFALLSAIGAGTSDFVGGLASRRAAALSITTFSHLGGAAVGVVLALVIIGDPTSADMAWGAVAGVGGAGGILSIYAGYARASVAIAAPVAGVGAAALPALVDALTGGDSLSAVAMAGVATGLVAIALVSMTKTDVEASVGSSLLYGLGGAVGLGLLLLGLAQTGDDAGMWPLAAARFAGFAALLMVMLGTRQPVAVPRAVLGYVVAIAVLNTTANALFILAARAGSTTVAAVVTSMFPAVTVIWAWRVFGERLRRVQVMGVLLALVAVGLIAIA